MPRLLNLYILKEITVPFILTLMILTVTAFLSKVIRLIDLVVTHGIGISFAFWFIVSIMPSFLRYTIPVSLLIAVLIAFTRLSSDNEITAMKASGLSLFTMMKPVMFMASLVFMATLLVTLYFFPWGNLNLKKLLYDAAQTNITAGLEEKTFYDRFKGMVLHVDHLRAGSNEMEGVFISESADGGESTIFFAERGVFVSSKEDSALYLKLYDGTIHKKSDGEDAYHIADFSTYRLELDVPKNEEVGLSGRANRELYPRELMAQMRVAASKGEETGPFLLDLHKRLALPASVFIFALLGVPLGMQRIRAARFTGFSIALGVALTYYMLSTGLEALGDTGALNPVLSAWGSDIIMGCAGLYLLYMAAKDRPTAMALWATRISAGVRNRFTGNK